MSHSFKIFKHVDNDFALKAGKEISEIVNQFYSNEHEALRKFLDKEDILTAFKAYININNNSKEEKAAASKSLETQFQILSGKIKAYCLSCLEGLKENKEKPETPFSHLKNLSDEINKEAPDFSLITEHYDTLKLEMARLTVNLKSNALRTCMNNIGETRLTVESRSKCTII